MYVSEKLESVFDAAGQGESIEIECDRLHALLIALGDQFSWESEKPDIAAIACRPEQFKTLFEVVLEHADMVQAAVIDLTRELYRLAGVKKEET